MKIALIQMKVGSDTYNNIVHASELTKTASDNGADIIVLPEMFTCEYESSKFSLNSFDTHSEFYKAIQRIAIENKKYLVAGSIPERDNGKIYNTCFVFNPDGEQIARHRKVHLFDIDVDGQYFKESETLSAGDEAVVFDTPFARIGVMICYDIRFPEFARLLVDKGAELIIVPAAFNMTTGPKHWELLFKARAVDNQVYMAGCASARNESAHYISYANSIVTSPWGEIIALAGTEEQILYANLDFDYLKRIRNKLPVLEHRRLDVY